MRDFLMVTVWSLGTLVAAFAAEPRSFPAGPATPIVASGIISADGSVQPIKLGSPVTPSGIISVPVTPAVPLSPVNPRTREGELANLALTQFLFDEHPARLRELDSQIAITQAEIDALNDRLATYRQFDKFVNNANPLYESQRRASVALVAAQERLANLELERGRAVQWLPAQIRRRQLELHRASDRFGNPPRGDAE